MIERPTTPDFPSPDVYEMEFEYWPWGSLIGLVERWVSVHAGTRCVVVDYMCGTGYLLDRISAHRPDLLCIGVTLDPEEVAYSKQRRPSLPVFCDDVLAFEPPSRVDIAICTGGIHHLPPPRQRDFLARVARNLSLDGHFLIGDEVIKPFTHESQRQLGVVELGSALLRHAIECGAPSPVIKAAIDVMQRDLFLAGEYKTDLPGLTQLLESTFAIESVERTWPSADSEYGDFFFVCRPKGVRIDQS